MTEYDGVLLASGGMDSTVLAYSLAKKQLNIKLLFLDYGQHCRDKELEMLRQVAHPQYKDNIKIIRIGDIYKESPSRMIREANLWIDNVIADDLYLPYRNCYFYLLLQLTLNQEALAMFTLPLSIVIMQKKSTVLWISFQNSRCY